MESLTLKETIILIVCLAAVISLVVSLVKNSLRLALCIVICVCLFSGFTWLPEKIAGWTGADKGIDNEMTVMPDVNDTVNGVKNTANEIIESEETQSWIYAGKTLWNKICGGDGTIDNDLNTTE